MDEFFEEQKEQARKLDDVELKKHAAVSFYHERRPYCMNCFCCACLVVRNERFEDN